MCACYKDVRALWRRIRRQTKYVPRLAALPYDFVRSSSRKQQEASLRKHAEKRALAKLAAASAGSSATLSLSINFHMCVDCHEYFKAATQILQRPIVVTEPKMTHRFKEGLCSCCDNWRPFYIDRSGSRPQYVVES